MKKIRISFFVGLTLLIVLLIGQLSLNVSYKDEVDVYQTAILVSKDMSKKDKEAALSRTQRLGQEIKKELKIVEVMIWSIVAFLVVISVLYLLAGRNHKKQEYIN